VTDTKKEIARFDELLRTYYHSWFRYRPEAAVDAGVPGYAHLLTPCGDEEKGALVCLNDELRVELEDISVDVLDADRRVDHDILTGAAQLENQFLLDIESLHPDPNRWLPVNAIYQLTIRAVENFDAAMESRLAAIPAHLSAAQMRLSAKARHVPPLWAQSAASAARGGVEFVRGLATHPKIAASVKRESIVAHLEKAATALAHYSEFLDSVVLPDAKGVFACGPEYFDHLLRSRHFLDVGADKLHAFGERLAAQTRAELEAACEDIYGYRDVAKAVRAIQSKTPDKKELLSVYASTMRAAREFVANRKLVSLPATERVEVIDTPVFLRHQIPFAAYCDPAPNDPAQLGYYYVTPPADAAQLAEHDTIGLMHTCVHEAYPGHHLHFVTVNGSATARALPRLLNASATCYEGWALYCEQLMQEEGFLSRPESRILLLRDRLWRALRICIDVELHTRGLSLEAAADRLVTALGFPKAQAIADVTWYTQSPTVPLGYATGWALINALRARVRSTEPQTSLQSFHDRLLSSGAIALPLAIQRAFGKEMWESVKADVFGT
jgi:uncharacterized protein (DUF885 family)